MAGDVFRRAFPGWGRSDDLVLRAVDQFIAEHPRADEPTGTVYAMTGRAKAVAAELRSWGVR